MAALPPTFVAGFHEEDVVQRMPYRPLRPGSSEAVSALALGGSPFGDVFDEACSQSNVDAIVLRALKGGVNLIDTAFWYGQGKSEERLGVALKDVPRAAYRIQSKCGRYMQEPEAMFDFSAERTLRAVDEALQRLGCEYLDCMQVHDPEFAPSVDIILEQTLPALQKAKDAGKIRSIGITGYPLALHREILERSTVKVDQSLSYCHYTLNDDALLREGFVDHLAEREVALVNASPIAMGLLSRGGPPAWHPASEDLKEAARKASAYCDAQGVDISRLALKFTLREPRIPTTLVGTAKLSELEANLETVYDLTMTEAEEAALTHIREDIFAPLGPLRSWEGGEVARYREAVAAKS